MMVSLLLILYRVRHGKMGSQLGADQKYYISRCEEKWSIQLTISVVGNKIHIEERKNLIDDIKNILHDIMKVFMPATKERPLLRIPCPLCPKLHIRLDQASNGKAIFCGNAKDERLPQGYYSELLQGRIVDTTNTAGKLIGIVTNYSLLHICCEFIEVHRKLEVFRAYYDKLIRLDFKRFYPRLLTAGIISSEDNRNAQTEQRCQASSCVWT